MYLLENEGEEVYKQQDFFSFFNLFSIYMHKPACLYLKLHKIKPPKEKDRSQYESQYT